MKLLEIKDLMTHFFTNDGIVRAVDGVSFTVDKGEMVGIVGESGSGKSVLSLSIMGLLPIPSARIVRGNIFLNGEDIVQASEKRLHDIRGNEIAMVFQEPMNSLNPVFTIGDQISEAIKIHQGLKSKELTKKTIEILEMVGISAPEKRISNYPHQLSGGMRQRVMIAIALSCTPKLLIADEPTTALDVTIQAQILHLIKELRKNLDMGVLLITHDLAVIAETVERVIVMYAGIVVEEASVDDIFESPLHPYTKGLMGAIPRLDADNKRLNVIKGVIPSPHAMPSGCRFEPRCPIAIEECRYIEPEIVNVSSSRKVRCLKYCETKRGVIS